MVVVRSPVLVSADGTKVAFVSSAGGLGPTDTNGQPDIYVRDVVSGTTELVSVNANGADAGHRGSSAFSFSPDGRSIAFQSNATDLVTTPNVTTADNIYLRDLTTDTTTLVTANVSGTDGAGSSFGPLVFSADGAHLAFASTGRGLTPVPTHFDVADVYVRDLSTGVTTLVSTNATGDHGGNGHSRTPSISPDGTAIAFASSATDLGPVDTDLSWEGEDDIYLHDLATSTTTMITTNASRTDSADGFSVAPSYSPDGGRIVFASTASDLGAADANGTTDVFVYDVASDSLSLVSVNAAGTAAANGPSALPSFSPDGSSVLFMSAANDLGPADSPRPGPPIPNQDADIYVRDLDTGAVTLVSANAAGDDSGNAESIMARFGPDGDQVVFLSAATDLGPRDSNDRADVYVRSLTGQVTWLVSGTPDGTDSANGGSTDPSFSPTGDYVVFQSVASDLDPDVPPFEPDDWNVYLAELDGADLGLDVDDEPDPVPSGEGLTYTAGLRNTGPDPATEVTFAIVLPEGTTFAAAETSRGACAPPTAQQPRVVTCAIGDLEPATTAALDRRRGHRAGHRRSALGGRRRPLDRGGARRPRQRVGRGDRRLGRGDPRQPHRTAVGGAASGWCGTGRAGRAPRRCR